MRPARRAALPLLQRDAQPERAGTLLEHRTVTEAHELAGQLVAREGETQLGTDAGRLPTRQCDTWNHGSARLARFLMPAYDLYSTYASSRMRRSHNSVSSSALLARTASIACRRLISSVLSNRRWPTICAMCQPN